MSRSYRFTLAWSLAYLTLAGLAQAQTYHEIGAYSLSSVPANALAVDSDGRRLFVAGGDGVTVLNLDNGSVMGTIGGLKDAQDVLLVSEMKDDENIPSTMGFTTDASGHVMKFSLADMKSSETIKMETPGGVALCYDKFTPCLALPFRDYCCRRRRAIPCSCTSAFLKTRYPPDAALRPSIRRPATL